MNGFRKLVIDNFQSHEHTEVDFTDGLNVFVGPSDSGKSAILRALKWVLFNTPRGTDFIRTGAKECRVRLIFSDGTEVSRIRSRSVNRYVLRTKDGGEQIFEGFGNTVPEEITNIHQIVPVELDQKELLLHFGNQLESPFLLFESNQNKAKTIGRISGAHLIDRALKKTSSDRLALSGQIKQLEQEKEKLEEKLKPYENLEQLEDGFRVAEKAFQEVQAKKQLKERLEKNLESLSRVRREKEKWTEKIAALEHLPAAEQAYLHLEYQKATLFRLNRLNDKWVRLQQEKQRNLEMIVQRKQIPETEKWVHHLLEYQVRFAQLVRIRKVWNLQQEKKARLKQHLAQLEQVPQGMQAFEQVAEKYQRLEVIQPLIHKKEKNRKEWNRWHQAEKQCQHTIEGLEEVVPKLTEKVAYQEKMITLYRNWQDKKNRIVTGKTYIKEKEQEVLHCTQEWARLLKQIGKCPTCKTPISHSVLEHIMEEYQGGISRAAAGREDQTT